MVTAFLIALCYIAIICIILTAFLRLVPGLPPFVATLAWAIGAVLCVLILIDLLSGGGHLVFWRSS